jgi:tyrosyl-tRNA synthetase
MTPAEQFAWLTRNTVRVYTEEDLQARLARGVPLRVKLGVDPTAPDIHLGHTVVLSKLREFQDLGHQAVLIIGDFTARIGDPSGRSGTRPQLSGEEVSANAATYLEQVFKVLDRERLDIHYNGKWFARFSFEEVVRLAARMTVAQVLERDDFQKRYQAGAPIGVHEFLYPLMQGWDSVQVRSDVELGGTDQTFNLLVGRDLQRSGGSPGQVAVVCPLLEGTDGVQKMSKSLGNHIGVAEPPGEMYGKLMSISDDLMWRYADLLGSGDAEARAAARRGDVHPMEAKKALAHEIVARFHGPEAADEAAGFFVARFQERSDNDPVQIRLENPEPELWICQLLKQVGFASSTSEARRLVSQGAVRVDGEPVGLDFRFAPGRHRLLAVGRRRLAAIEVAAPKTST